MRFEGRHEGITYAVSLKPKADDKRLLARLRVEIYRKYPSGEKRGHAWEIAFDSDGISVEKHEYDEFKAELCRLTIKARWIEPWRVDEVEETIRGLGVKDAVEHFLKHLRLIFDHPLAIPLRL
jgi:hypothetical protein